ncbi:MAG: DUF1289 domain-containing protein [Roseibium sp.]
MKSPCINICQIDQASRLCTGCWRSLDEIASWASYSNEQRQSVLNDLDRRRDQDRSTGTR